MTEETKQTKETKTLFLGPCCGCMSRQDVHTIVQHDRRLPEEYCGQGAGWACLACRLPADGAVSVMCDGCLAKGIEPIACVLGGWFDGRLLPLDFPIVPLAHDLHFHPEKFPANTPGAALVYFADDTDDLCSWCGRWIDPEGGVPVIMIDGAGAAFLHEDCFEVWYKERM